jgi:putative transposase
MCEILSENH